MSDEYSLHTKWQRGDVSTAEYTRRMGRLDQSMTDTVSFNEVVDAFEAMHEEREMDERRAKDALYEAVKRAMFVCPIGSEAYGWLAEASALVDGWTPEAARELRLL